MAKHTDMERKAMNSKSRGFTLVEMAIVLVIIGIILAGVMKGRDIVRGSQVKQFSQQFAQKWATIAQTYYDKTGQLLLDSSANGATSETNPPDGTMDGGLATDIGDVEDVLEKVGITPCTLIKSKLTSTVAITGLDGVAVHCSSDGTAANMKVNVVQTTVEGEYAGTRVVQAELGTVLISLGGKTLRRNLVILYNVPPDVAQGLDTAIDGKADGESGSCIGLGDAYAVDTPAASIPAGFPHASTSEPATAWADASQTQCQTVGIILDY